MEKQQEKVNEIRQELWSAMKSLLHNSNVDTNIEEQIKAAMVLYGLSKTSPKSLKTYFSKKTNVPDTINDKNLIILYEAFVERMVPGKKPEDHILRPSEIPTNVETPVPSSTLPKTRPTYCRKQKDKRKKPYS